MPSPHVIVIGGGLAGLSASVALSDAGCRVSLFEKSPRLGGRATSYVLPDGEQIDNCQHVTLRCCTNLEDFYSRIGVAGKIAYYDSLAFANSDGGRAIMKPSSLPAPLHLLPSFATFSLLEWSDKHAIAHAMLRIVIGGGKPKLRGPVSMLEWLKRQRQTPQAINRFWRTVLVSALNEELESIDAGYGIAVFWKAFLSNRTAFIMGIPSVPLAELYTPGGECIVRNGGQVRVRSGVSAIRISEDRAVDVQLDDGSNVEADYYVAALPFDRLLRIVPDNWKDREPFSNLKQFRVSPITGVHMWFDRTVMKESFLASVDQTIQWVFNKQAGRYLQIVISASHGLSHQSQQEILEMCSKELAQLIPASRDAKLNRSIVVREGSATFSPQPGCDQWRPVQRTPMRNLFLAGDWTQTGWPATMESAVRSGYLAAEAILATEGRPTRLVRPELPPTGLARWLARA